MKFKRKRSKFNNKKTTVDGILFDSKLESDYYLHLLQMQKNGNIKGFTLQPVFLLQPSFKKMGRTIRKIEYKADFLVEYEDGRKLVVDTKGIVTDVFKIKAKLFNHCYPDLELKVVKKEDKW